jgi:hypothetical protein
MKRKAESAPKKNPVGRPSAYKQAFAEQAYKLCLLGAIDADMADFFGIGEATINRWKLAHPEFRESIKRGKMNADANVAEALHKRAIGYSHPDVHISNYQGEITITNITKHYPPDTAAMIFWLKNRQPDKWREKFEMDHDVSMKFPSADELNRIYVKKMRLARERQAAVLAERRAEGFCLDE